nr:MAG TPA: putative cellulase [Caudoviricetes sp.]
MVPPCNPCGARIGTTGTTGTTLLLKTPYIYISRFGERLEKGGSRWGRWFHFRTCNLLQVAI